MTREKNWKFECSARMDGDSYTVELSGYIKKDNRNAAASVKALLAEAPENAPVRVLLKDFFGGDIIEGLAIHAALQERAVPIDADGLVASMGTVIMCAGSPVRATRRMKGMMHRATGEVRGNADQLADVATQLKDLESSLVAIIAERTGLDAQTTRARFMAEGRDTWFTADQLKELGLVDEVVASEVRTVPLREARQLKTPEAALARFAACYEDEPTPEAGKPKAMNKKITAALGLAEGADENAVETRIEAILAENTELKGKVKQAAEAARQQELTAALDAIGAALKQGRITKAQADVLNADAKENPSVVRKTLTTLVASMAPHSSLSARLGAPGAATGTLEAVYVKRATEGWDFLRWSKEAAADLEKLKEQHVELYNELRKTL